ncbi:hypothetical protein EYF80_064470 [Liparis tanakae]|uniref:Uncharacterized protein n=1 Tax=Liparis tanakae TaxID=230148 RepID=A0A4Z2E9H6_9TELE|nr:hypothetical protein EYF80_064470 [Liparis tanakae]
MPVAGRRPPLAALPGRLQDARQVLVQDGLGVLLTLAAEREQRVMEGGAGGEVDALLTLLLLDGQRKDRWSPHHLFRLDHSPLVKEDQDHLVSPALLHRCPQDTENLL